MNDDVRAEAIELSITACEKYAQNYEVTEPSYIDLSTFTSFLIKQNVTGLVAVRSQIVVKELEK